MILTISFRSRVSSVLSITRAHTEIPANDTSTTIFTELRDSVSLLQTYTYQYRVRVSIGGRFNLYSFSETLTLT